MARDYKAYGSSFVKGVLAKIGNAEKRTQIEKLLLEDEEVAAVLPDIGQGVFFQSDYSRHMNEIDEAAKAKQTQLDTEVERLKSWWEVNQAALVEYKKLSDEGMLPAPRTNGNGDRTPTRQDPASGLTRKELESFVGEREELAAGYMNAMAKLTARHLRNFDEELDPDAVVKHARAKSLPLEAAYADLYKAEYAEKAKKAQDARDEALRKEGEERFKTAHAAENQPYPVRGGADTSPLAALDAVKSDNAAVAGAVAEYEKLVAARG